MRRLVFSLSFLALGLAFGAKAQELNFEDVESRIDYGWFTEDANALRNLIQSTRAQAQKATDTPASRYLTALAHYRLGSLLAADKPVDAAASMSHCVEDAGYVAETQSQSKPESGAIESAEALALQAICYARLADLSTWKSMVNNPLSAIKMEKALKLAPGNPRVALLDAARDYAQAKAGEKASTLDKFRRTLELYEISFQTRTAPAQQTPTWGYADTYAYIGQCLREKSDLLGARNAYERALIVAPDFAAVRRELQELLRN